ncbi:MAG: hypothetical protein JWQ20_1611 [Conexibacter sp.]|nr:hypothetical protein [Conexibacter sp.]
MPRRIDLGRAVLIAGAALLLISLFLKWYDTGPTGWEVFEAVDLLLAAIALGMLVAALRPDVMTPRTALALPAVAVAIVVVQLVNAPPAAADGHPSTGAWLALAGSLVMAAGAALSLAAISVTVQVQERDVRRRMPAVDRRGERDTAAAEDLDADAARAGDDASAPDERVVPPRRPARRRQRERPAAVSDPGDLERTQPLSGPPERDPDDAERP